jgi:hypothetical protein
MLTAYYNKTMKSKALTDKIYDAEKIMPIQMLSKSDKIILQNM